MSFTFKTYLGWITLVSIMLLLQFWSLQPSLSYSQTALQSGEIWRLILAHFVHLSWAHTILNIAGLTLCTLLNPNIFRPKLIIQLIFLSVGISLMLWSFSPNIENYVGFSGILYGLFVIALWPLRKNLISLLMLFGVIFWAVFQWRFGVPTTEEEIIGGQVITIAHLYGLVLAMVWIFIEYYLNVFILSLRE
jgi:rhomboid family GlyGly-CTERM serine protease